MCIRDRGWKKHKMCDHDPTAQMQLPAVRTPVAAVATPLLAHLSLLFVPVGVGVVAYLGLIGQYGVRMLLALVLSTWVGLLVTALVLRALWPRGAGGAPAG